MAAVLAASLASCSRGFEIIPAGTLDSGIYFEFGTFDGTRTRNRIVAFNVYTYSDEGDRELIWALEGRARVGAIRYGVPPAKLTAQSPAPALEVMRVYTVQAQDQPRGLITPPGGALLTFYVSETGVPIECESLPRCSEAMRNAAGESP